MILVSVHVKKRCCFELIEFTGELRSRSLESKEDQEGHHQAKETHGLGQGEAKDGVREELLLQRRVSGISDNQTAEDAANTSP